MFEELRLVKRGYGAAINVGSTFIFKTRTAPWQFLKPEVGRIVQSRKKKAKRVELNSTAIEGSSDENHGACQNGIVTFPTHNSLKLTRRAMNCNHLTRE